MLKKEYYLNELFWTNQTLSLRVKQQGSRSIQHRNISKLLATVGKIYGFCFKERDDIFEKKFSLDGRKNSNEHNPDMIQSDLELLQFIRRTLH